MAGSRSCAGRTQPGGRHDRGHHLRRLGRRGTKHLRPEYAKRLRAEKQAGGSGWETIKWKQRLYEDMCIEVARANYAMLKERTLPPRVA